jgi:hypothetical protein
LKSLNDELTALRAGGVDVVAITAEPGDVTSRLVEKYSISLDFEIQSDPDHVSLKEMDTDIFVVHPAAPEDAPIPYQMIQPAMVVVSSTGAIIPECSWSWKTMGYENVGEMDRVTTEPWAGPVKEVALVTLRPVMSDLLLSIQEKRQVKLASTHDEW